MKLEHCYDVCAIYKCGLPYFSNATVGEAKLS